MVSDAIERIQAAEKRAEEEARDAKARAREIVAGAHEASERMLDEMKRRVRDEAESLLSAAREEAGREAEALAGESRSNTEAVRRAGEKGIEAGVKKVLDAIAAAAK